MTVELAFRHVHQDVGSVDDVNMLVLKALNFGTDVHMDNDERSFFFRSFLQRDNADIELSKYHDPEDDTESHEIEFLYNHPEGRMEFMSDTCPMLRLINTGHKVCDVLDLDTENRDFWIFYEYAYEGELGNFDDVLDQLPEENITDKDLTGETTVYLYEFNGNKFLVSDTGEVEPRGIELGDAQTIMYDFTQHLQSLTS